MEHGKYICAFAFAVKQGTTTSLKVLPVTLYNVKDFHFVKKERFSFYVLLGTGMFTVDIPASPQVQAMYVHGSVGHSVCPVCTP